MYSESSCSFLSPFLSLGELDDWGFLGTLPSCLVSWGLFLILPGSEDGDEERGNWPFFPSHSPPVSRTGQHLLGPSTELGLGNRAHDQK